MPVYPYEVEPGAVSSPQQSYTPSPPVRVTIVDPSASELAAAQLVYKSPLGYPIET